MSVIERLSSVSDTTLNWLIRGAIMVLAIGIPLLAALYFLDHGTDHGPTLIERQIATAEDVVRKAPDQLGPRIALAQVYQAARRPDSALEQYDEVLKVSALNKTALLGRGDILLDKGDLVGAAKAFKKVADTAAGGEFSGIDPQLEHAYYGLGSVALKQDRARDAVSAFEHAVTIKSTDADAWYLLGTAALQAGDAEHAAGALERAILFVPTGWCEPYDALSQAYAKLGRGAKAEYAAAMVDFCKNRTSAAVSRLEGLTSGPAALEAMLGIGMIAETTNDRAAAVRAYRKVLAADPGNFNALSGLSRLGAKPVAHPKSPSGGSSSNGATS